MRTQTARQWGRAVQVISIAAALVLISCDQVQVAGIQGSGGPAPATAVGPITGFGSIFVNGVEYATSGAQIRINGEPGTEAQLRVGQIVTVKGTVNEDEQTGTAEEVSFVGDVQGPIVDLDVVAGTFTVLSQRIRVTDETLFDEALQPADIEGLQNGANVEVSGFTDANGDLVASRIDLESPSAPLQVTGTVRELNTAARTFLINELVVDYSAVTPVGTLEEGATANVRGTAASVDGPLVATSVEVSPGAAGALNERGEVVGFITRFDSNADFVVNSQRVVTNADTRLVPGNLVLGLNVRVKIEGTFNGSGALVAERIEEKRGSSSAVRGLVDSVSAQDDTLVVLGVTVTITEATAFEDKSDQKRREFRLSDVRIGDFVDVRGAPGQPGEGLVATVVERKRPDDRSRLQGVAVDVAEPNLTVLGVTVMTNAETEFVGLGDPSEAAERFFSEAPGQIVKLRGSLSGDLFVADRAEIVH